jgi:ATP-dependent Lhr-like helicase
MIRFVRKPFTQEESLGCLEKYVREWFSRSFQELTPPQRYSFKLISRGNNVIITAPTGSGKTLAGFTAILSELFKMGEKGRLRNSVYCIYISPLKALDNDVKKNLMVPLVEIRKIAEEMGFSLPEVRIAVRTGDVPSKEKQRQLKNPPHILITTPESLAVLLNAPRFSAHLCTVRWVVVDEIHELANNKRGVHLSLSLERLRELTKKDFIRIGLGATLHPIKEAARYLVGFEEGVERSCRVVDVSWYKPYDLKLLCPVEDLIHTSTEALNRELYRLVDELIKGHKTTLVFTNTRSGTERVVFNLKDKYGYSDDSIGAHHGSLSREIRLDVEDRLKRGLLKTVVCSTSLELGIDIGYIDLVVQIGSPKSVTRAVQRIGRSGHRFQDLARGRIIALDRDDLIEDAVMLRCAMMRRLDEIMIPKNCLDILAQHIVGMGLVKKWRVDEALEVVRRSYLYHDLKKKTFISLLHYLAGHYAELEDRRVYGKIWFDEEEGVFGRRGKYTRVIYYLNLGAIPDEVKIDVYQLPGKRYVGGIEEGFLERLKPRDIFVLGGKLYRFRYARGMRCFVEAAPKEALPTIPAWFSEMLPLSFDLAGEIRRFRGEVRKKLTRGKREGELVPWILKQYPVDENSARSIYSYFYEQHMYSRIPGENEILVEETRDLEGRRFMVFHSLFGRRTNDALSRGFAAVIVKQIRHSVGVIISDNGFALRLPEDIKVDVDIALKKLWEMDLGELLRRSIRRTELMKRRFRHCAARSFLVLRNYKGYKISVSRQQMNSQTLLNVCEEVDRDFPVIAETYREILEDIMDIKRASLVLKRIREGRIKIVKAPTEVPSPFAHNLIILGEADVILMEDRKRRLLELYNAVMQRIKKDKGPVSPR